MSASRVGIPLACRVQPGRLSGHVREGMQRSVPRRVCYALGGGAFRAKVCWQPPERSGDVLPSISGEERDGTQLGAETDTGRCLGGRFHLRQASGEAPSMRRARRGLCGLPCGAAWIRGGSSVRGGFGRQAGLGVFRVEEAV